jgi:hypothetical protein
MRIVFSKQLSLLHVVASLAGDQVQIDRQHKDKQRCLKQGRRRIGPTGGADDDGQTDGKGDDEE